ncbi:MAG TPA: hypothetical protein VKQ36_05755 [Ktedonobacterales bacterium]|nr:hypothetical protein [Ktedonobacterales bacterium]
MPSLTTSDVALIEVGVALLQTILLAVAGFVAFFQLRATQKSRYLESLVRMFEDFGSRGAYADADAVLGLPASFADYSSEEVELATWVTRVYEKIAFLVESDMIPADYLVPLYSRRIIWTWDALQPFIQEQRRLRDSGGEYRIAGDGRYFEMLASRALDYRKKIFKDPSRVHSPVPKEYRQRVMRQLARGERLGALGLE